MKIEKFSDEEYEVSFTDIDFWPEDSPESILRRTPLEQERLVRNILDSSIAGGFRIVKPIVSVVRKNNSNSWIVTCQ